MRFRRIGVVAPAYSHQSAGIRMLHWLVHSLRELGFDARWIPERHPFLTGRSERLGKRVARAVGFSDRHRMGNPAWDVPVLDSLKGLGLREVQEEWIVVYPEAIFGNPLGAKRVVRYLLNQEGALGGRSMGAEPSDFLMAYSRTFHASAPVLYYPLFDGELLLRAGQAHSGQRTLCAYYRGKGVLYGECPEIPGSVEIRRDWPRTKAEYYALLEQVRVLYSYDWVSSTMQDAVLLGCEVRLVGSPGGLGEAALMSEDFEIRGIWHRTEEPGGGLYIPPGLNHVFLGQVQKFRAEFPVRLLTIFGEEIRHLHA